MQVYIYRFIQLFMVAFALGTLFVKTRMSTTTLQVRGIPTARHLCCVHRPSARASRWQGVAHLLAHVVHRLPTTTVPACCWSLYVRLMHRSLGVHMQGGREYIAVLFYCAYFLTASGWSELSIAVRCCQPLCAVWSESVAVFSTSVWLHSLTPQAHQ